MSITSLILLEHLLC